MLNPLPPTVRSATRALQVLISGAVRDNLTNEGPGSGLEVRLVERASGEDYPLTSKVMPDGTYAFYGVPVKAFPLITTETYQLRVEANAPNYLPASADLDIGPVADQPEMVTRTVQNMADMRVRLFTAGLPREINLTLNRSAVRLTGRVVAADNPSQGVSGAEIRVNALSVIPATTDADGFFSFTSPLPVMLTVNLNVIAPPNFANRSLTYEPDYSLPVNTIVILLMRS